MKIARSLRLHYELFGIKGVAQRAMLSVPGAPEELTVHVPHPLTVRLGTTDVAAYKHVFVDNEYNLPIANAPAVIVDGGANIGMASAYFALKYPRAKIIAVEPHPRTFKVLEKNARSFPNITPVNAAIWNCNGTISIHSNSDKDFWGMRVSKSTSDLKTRAVTLDTLLDEHGISQVDLLKLDVEGAEKEIFSSSDNWISDVSMICTELHDRFKEGCAEAFEAATIDFSHRWHQGELSCVARSRDFCTV
jgi:FkbM family methyltransferase